MEVKPARRRRATNSLPSGEFTAEVVDLAADGRGIARVEGKVTFIADALPGERVRFRYRRQGRDVDEGQVVAVEQASADRVEPPCAHFGICGGCALQHLAPAAQILFKQKQVVDALARVGKVTPEELAAPITGPSAGYRRRARLGVRYVEKRGAVLVGFRERESPLLAGLNACAVLDPRIGQCLVPLAEMVAGLSIRNALPQVEIACSERVALVFRVLQAPSDADRERLAAFGERHAFDVYLQPGGPDTVHPLQAPAAELFYSPDGSEDLLRFEPTDFIQINAEVSRRSVQQALSWLDIQPGERVLELFCGLGNFSIPLARRGAQVVAVEGEAGLVRRARDNAERLGLQIEFSQADLFKPDPWAPWLQGRYDAALLDPPRAGAQEILPALVSARPQRILYVSCHPGTLARDAGQLVHEHGYRLVRAGVMDMFPHTAHVESMALFVKR